MKESITKRIEVFANISIILVAILGSFTLMKGLFPDKQKPVQVPITSTGPAPPAGTHLTLGAIDWAQSERTLLLGLSTNCHFCTESAPFYQRLVQEARLMPNRRIVAVFPQDIAEGKKYLKQLAVPIEPVVQAQLFSIGMKGTPTLILVDKKGLVKKTWVGRLPSAMESEVLDQLKCDTCD